MASTDTSLAGVAVALPAKRGKGRRPVRESHRGEILDAVTAWKMTPLAKREPPTLTELAAKLGATKQLVHYYYKQASGSVEEFIDQCEREVLQRYPCVLDALTRQAEKGNVEAAKAYMRGLVEPRRPQHHSQSAMLQDVLLNQTLHVLLESGDKNAVIVSSIPENAVADTSKRQILSNSHADEESTS